MKSERFPDFIIAGAPKCGTTALYEYLREHPLVFMPQKKEPHYFCTDFPNHPKVPDTSDYLALFRDAPDNVLIGEASVWYLYSEAALGNIMAANPQAKIIVMLRNPVDMAYSLHAQQLHCLREDIEDFQLAWELQEARARGLRLPKYVEEPKFLQYRKVCSFPHQISRLMAQVPIEQRLILIFEEFSSDTTQAYEQVLKFLGLPSDGRSVFPRVNANSARKSVGLQELMARTSRLMGPAYTPAKRLCNRFGLTPGRRLNQWNTKRVERSPLRDDFRRHLYDEFRTDIQELEELLGRRLPWCQYAGN
jgi:hypothetical protein